MKRFTLLVIAVIVTAALSTSAISDERDATAEERAKVVEALSAIGCPDVGEVELDGDYFEAEDVMCNDGKKYEEVFLDQDMNIVKKKLDD